ncbi:DUF4214 domain-containing protein [Devosia sp. SD17-2]|uniref:DUF4214 domain-containing protein n=1 Tax=Devosia sp. SD17-2 TaxID=2976459 RepID=UPI0023D89979|nr:DUF4214 domain-containing protein [Devosia sp. SD17-2]WEJ33848.1 DUF4214 domain-containing protein [Devosia sp. SD17-2]
MATIQGVYVALFGRPADPLGLAYWQGVTNDGADLSAIGDLAAMPEYQDRFAGQTNAQIVNSIYRSLFNRDSDAAGLSFWVQGLDSGEFNINDVAIRILDGAQGADKTTVDNKIEAADLYTESLDTGAEIAQYSGNEAAAIGREYLATVTTAVPDQAAVDAAIARLFDTGGPDGTTLTTGADVVTANLINAPLIALPGVEAAETLNSFDVITGAGEDATLVATLRGSQGPVSPTLKGVENVVLTSIAPVDAVLDLRNATGVNSIANEWSDGGLEIRNIAFVEGFELSVSDTGAGSSFAFTESSVDGDADELALTVSNVDGGVSISGNGEGIETVNLVSEGIENNIGLGVSGLATLNISGDADLNIGSAIGASTIDASGLEANLSIDLLEGLTERDVTYTGAVGNDSVYAGTSLTSADTLDGGEGEDTLILTNAGGVFFDSEEDGDINVVNFETLGLDLTDDSALDYAAFSDDTEFSQISVIAVDNGDGNSDQFDLELNNLRSVSNFLFQSDNVRNVAGDLISEDEFDNIDIVYAEDEEVRSVNIDFVNRLVIGDSLDVTNLNVAVDADFDDDELTTINLSANSIIGAGDTVTIGDLNTDSVETLNITGSANLTISTALSDVIEEVNAGDFTGDLVVALGDVTDGGTITSGSGDDVLTGGAGDDTILGGAGDDTINGGGGNNILTGGAGSDTFVVRDEASTANGIDRVTDFTAGDNGDILDIDTANEATGAANFLFVTTNAGIVGVDQVFSANSNLVTISETASAAELAGLFGATGALSGVTETVAGDFYMAFQTSGGNVNLYLFSDTGVNNGAIEADDTFALVTRLTGVSIEDLNNSNFDFV